MKRHHPPIITLALLALLVGLSISGGPVIWAVLVMVSPLVIAIMLTSRSFVHGAHPAEVKRPVQRHTS